MYSRPAYLSWQLTSSVIAARQELPGEAGEAASQARELLHYEPVEANLLLGRWDDVLTEIEALKQGQRLVEGSAGLAFPEPMQTALVAASHGLQVLVSLHAGAIEPEAGRLAARQAFEEAMLNFYRFSGQIDWDLYFRCTLADDLADEDVNPLLILLPAERKARTDP
jgi:hypothetical protein